MRFVIYTNESAIARPANRETFPFRMEENYSLRMVYALQWTSAKKHWSYGRWTKDTYRFIVVSVSYSCCKSEDQETMLYSGSF